MQSHDDLTGGGDGDPIHAALLAYARFPGKYPVGLRQPPLLFASVREIVQLATGRGASAAPPVDPRRIALQKAACFFVKTALFHPAADHYALLGLERTADEVALKDRYRLLMRLIHPDFSGAGPSHWPADAAVRVNLAYEVLSSPVRRRNYDASLTKAPHRPVPAKPVHQRVSQPRRAHAHAISRAGYGRLITACGVAGALVLIALFMSGRDGVQLVQRETLTALPPVAVVAQDAQKPAPPAPPLAAVHVEKPPTPPQQIASLPIPDKGRQAPAAPAAKVAAPPAPARATAPARPSPQPLLAVARAQVDSPAPVFALAPAAAAPLPTAVPAAALPPAPAVAVAVSAPVAAPVVRASRPAPLPGPSLAEAQPLLSALLQHLESGRGDRLITMLDREARNHPAAQALSRHYDSLVDGMKPVRLSHVDFRAEPADGRLFVVGNIGLQLGDHAAFVNKRMMVRAEFASREGSIVMTGLSGGQGN